MGLLNTNIRYYSHQYPILFSPISDIILTNIEFLSLWLISSNNMLVLLPKTASSTQAKHKDNNRPKHCHYFCLFRFRSYLSCFLDFIFLVLLFFRRFLPPLDFLRIFLRVFFRVFLRFLPPPVLPE